jgi:hypothetical protein
VIWLRRVAWRLRWWRDERQSLAELRRGEGVVFSDPGAAAAWLRSED